MAKRRLADPSALLVSLALHAGLLGMGAWLVGVTWTRESSDVDDTGRTVEVTLEESGATRARLPRVARVGRPWIAAAPRAPAADYKHASNGGTRVARPAMRRSGRGGTETSSQRALNLADSIDGITLNRDPMTRLDRSQLTRLQTARQRQTRDDRRATPNPMQLTFLASGDGLLRERRPPSRFNPASGRSSGSHAHRPGGPIGTAVDAADGRGAASGADRPGAQPIVAAGIALGAARGGHRRSAAVVHARPAVTRARAAVAALDRGRPQDDMDSAQEVATAVQSLIHASAAGGTVGLGRGGQSGPGGPASGGESGSGSRSMPAGRGGSGDVALDPRFGGYHRGLIDHVNRYWAQAFPAWAIAEGRGGMAIVEMTLARDGSLASVRVVRPSGIPEFDRNLVAAVHRAAPFAPLPSPLTPYHRVSIQFDATNPAVGRDGP